MAAPTITALPTAPQRTDAPTTFSSRADAFVAAQAQFVSEMNTAIAFLNTLVQVNEILGMDYTGLSPLQSVRLNSGGDALEAYTPVVPGDLFDEEWLSLGYTGISASQSVRLNSAGNALEGYTPMVKGVDDLVPIVTDASTSRTLDRDDHGSHIRFTAGATVTVTAPNSTTDPNMEAGVCISLFQAGAGQVQLAADSGVTLNYNSDFNPYAHGQKATIVITCVSPNEYDVSGHMEAV